MKRALDGENLVRIAYLDESGRSRNEPTIVVAGVIVHGDRTYRRLEDAIRDIAREELPDGDSHGFIFHATDLFHGSRYFDRRKWPEEQRHRILARLAALPSAFALPVVFGHVAKSEHKQQIESLITATGKSRESLFEVVEHMSAFTRAEIAIERQMRLFPRDEICMLIAEDTDRMRQALKASHAFLRDPNEMAKAGYSDVDGLPLLRIVDTPHFAAKRDSPLLQLADLCAFLIMRRLARKDATQPFFESIAPQIYWHASDFGEAMGTEQICGGKLY